jgi:hypothetical protein
LDKNRAISSAELERMMKLQDVILKAMAKKLTWLEAAEIIGVCDRTMRRMRERRSSGRESRGHLGAAYAIPIIYVPALMITHDVANGLAFCSSSINAPHE